GLIFGRFNLLYRIINRHHGLKQIVNTTRGHQRVGHRHAVAQQVFADDGLQLGNDLPVSQARIFTCAAEHRDLKKQLEWNERSRQPRDAGTALTKVLPDQIEVTTQPTIRTTQPAIDASVFKRSKNSAREL